MTEEVGQDPDCRSWGERHNLHGWGAAAGRGLRILTADAKRRLDHSCDGHRRGHHFLGKRHADRHGGDNLDPRHEHRHSHENTGPGRADPLVPRGSCGEPHPDQPQSRRTDVRRRCERLLSVASFDDGGVAVCEDVLS